MSVLPPDWAIWDFLCHRLGILGNIISVLPTFNSLVHVACWGVSHVIPKYLSNDGGTVLSDSG